MDFLTTSGGPWIQVAVSLLKPPHGSFKIEAAVT
jgi:hypothetical protein